MARRFARRSESARIVLSGIAEARRGKFGAQHRLPRDQLRRVRLSDRARCEDRCARMPRAPSRGDREDPVRLFQRRHRTRLSRRAGRLKLPDKRFLSPPQARNLRKAGSRERVRLRLPDSSAWRFLMRLERGFRVALFFAAACSTPAFAATHVIDVGPGGSFSFSPATITIPPGDTITFQSNAGIAHNAVSDDGTTFNSGPAVAGPWTYVTPALAAGTYPFHCTV